MKHVWFVILSIFFISISLSSISYSQDENDFSEDGNQDEGSQLNLDSSGTFQPKYLDGVQVHAVETYLNPKNHELGFGLGLYPSDSYYTGFGVNVGYTYYINKNLAVEVPNLTYLFAVDSDLTSQLATTYGVTPEQIERTSLIMTANLILIHTYGKLVFLENYIRYFRSGLIMGLGLITTNIQSRFAVNLGIRFDAYISDSFSWRIELRNQVAVTGGLENNLGIHFGAGLSL